MLYEIPTKPTIADISLYMGTGPIALIYHVSITRFLIDGEDGISQYRRAEHDVITYKIVP